MIRLSLEDRITEYLPLEHFLPQAGQGVLAIEVRADDQEMASLVQPLNHEVTWQSVAAERALLQALGGGCSTAAASLGRVSGSALSLQGMVVGNEGIIYASGEGNATTPEDVAGQLAQRLLKMGAGQSAARKRN